MSFAAYIPEAAGDSHVCLCTPSYICIYISTPKLNIRILIWLLIQVRNLPFHLANGTRLKPHGREWQSVMRNLFGLVPRVTHRFDIQRSQPRPYRYECGCQIHHFTARRHALVVKGRRYRCRHCDQILVYSAFKNL